MMLWCIRSLHNNLPEAPPGCYLRRFAHFPSSRHSKTYFSPGGGCAKVCRRRSSVTMRRGGREWFPASSLEKKHWRYSVVSACTKNSNPKCKLYSTVLCIKRFSPNKILGEYAEQYCTLFITSCLLTQEAVRFNSEEHSYPPYETAVEEP